MFYPLDTADRQLYANPTTTALIRFKGAGMQATATSPNWVTGSATAPALSLQGPVIYVTAAGVLPDGSTKTTHILGEYMKRLGCLATVLICLLAAVPAVYGQSVTGQISGTVVDPAGAIIPG